MIIVPATDTSAQQSNSEPNRQSQEIEPMQQQQQQCNVESGDSSTRLAAEKNGNKHQIENDDVEQHLMSPKVYQNTTEPVHKIDHHHRPSKWSSMNCRRILWYVTFVGFMVNYMYRININIAIVEMVSIKKTTVSSDHSSECIAHQMTQSSVNVTTTMEVISYIYVLCVFPPVVFM